MGLDMFLRAEKYISDYRWGSDEEESQYKTIVDLFQAQPFVDPSTSSGTVSLTVGYWRKANAIHKWFVDTVQKGEDDCGTYYVSRDQLKELREVCLRVLGAVSTVEGQIHVGTSFGAGVQSEHYEVGQVVANPETAAALLPTADGFFFGSTGYHEGYLLDVKETITIIDRALAMPTDWTFQYHASW
jgi:hypothetical protein